MVIPARNRIHSARSGVNAARRQDLLDQQRQAGKPLDALYVCLPIRTLIRSSAQLSAARRTSPEAYPCPRAIGFRLHLGAIPLWFANPAGCATSPARQFLHEKRGASSMKDPTAKHGGKKFAARAPQPYRALSLS